jgi:hypothetical protein
VHVHLSAQGQARRSQCVAAFSLQEGEDQQLYQRSAPRLGRAPQGAPSPRKAVSGVHASVIGWPPPRRLWPRSSRSSSKAAAGGHPPYYDRSGRFPAHAIRRPASDLCRRLSPSKPRKRSAMRALGPVLDEPMVRRRPIAKILSTSCPCTS